MKKIPKFSNEDEERGFWSTHSPLDYFNVDNAYPVRIVDMTKAAKSEKIRQFELSSFMMGPPLAEVFEKIDRSMTFFSIYIVMENLEENLWEQSRYVDKEKVYLCSLVEEEIRRYWWDRNREHLERIDDLVESYRNDSNRNKMTEGELMDKSGFPIEVGAFFFSRPHFFKAQ